MIELAKALVAANAELSNPVKDSSNPFFNAKYAGLDQLVDQVRAVYAQHGLTLIQELQTTVHPGSDLTIYMVDVHTLVIHTSGEERRFGPFSLPVESGAAAQSDGKKQANLPQKLGTAATYARRYALMAVTGLAPEDDDGNGADSPTPPAKNQTPINARAAVGEVQSGARIEARRLYSSLGSELQQAVGVQFKKSTGRAMADAGEVDMPRLQMLCRVAALSGSQHDRLTELLQINVVDVVAAKGSDIALIDELINQVVKSGA